MSRIWDWLRMTRANLPGAAAGDPDRSHVYRAALEQFEELIRAASEVGPSSRPLPLFYALAQAGRAIVAARGGPDHRGHGLRLGAPQPDPLETSVIAASRQKQPGHFQAVLQAVGSPALGSPAPIGALIASLPELAGVLFMKDEWPMALPVFERPTYQNIPIPGWTAIVILVGEEIQTWADLEQLTSNYPTVKGQLGEAKQVMILPSLPRYPTPEGLGVGALLKGGPQEFDVAAPQYRITGRRWLRPAIAAAVAPTPLMTWWAVLYALSMYARYHPAEWVAALDIDASNSAVTLERAMARALEALPQLVLSELVGMPFLVPDAAGWGADPFG
jgi:hypothetical protein